MNSVLELLLSGFVGYAGFACLALAMPRHWKDLMAQRFGPIPPRRWLRPAGFSLLGVAYLLCIMRDGPSFGSLLWLMLISASAACVAFSLSLKADAGKR
ncbi:DUF3325 domain-containing protein [Pseudomonas sp. OTU750018]|uniref:DUF3325 domain-containing protein n=1 Tax=Pseudomonas sp. OTU750018 TaxID=2709708 RepID=UPI001420540E|nr:DUF3325 domain-containing protein [Pseudomonas sp. OTU750018]